MHRMRKTASDACKAAPHKPKIALNGPPALIAFFVTSLLLTFICMAPAQSVVTLKKQARSGSAYEQFILGTMYNQGISVQQDYARAVFWYRKAAEQGYADAQGNLCEMYGDGHGVPQDYAQALAWCRKAAEQGLAPAQYSLGASYYQGHGVPQDYAEAYFWFDVAEAGKFKSSNVKQEDVYKYRDEAATHLSPDELTSAQERARQWFESHPSKSK